MTAKLSQRPFGHIQQHPATLYTLSNRNGMSVSVSDFGAIITSIQVPARHGLHECVLGFEQAADYAAPAYRAQYPYLGAVIGRHAGRIRQARAPLNGRTLQLAANHQGHQLHGGHVGFDSVPWRFAGSHCDDGGVEIRLNHRSPDGDQGYPGQLDVSVCYRLDQHNALSVHFEARSNADTLLNLTQHSYFHLGKPGSTVADHQLQINANHILATDSELMPTGQLSAVAGTPLDFCQPHTIAATAIDTAYVLPEYAQPLQPIAAPLHPPNSGIGLRVYTDNPVLVVYNGGFLPNLAVPGRKPLQPYGGICFEAQGYTDAANHPEFPANLLRAGEIYRRSTVYAFVW